MTQVEKILVRWLAALSAAVTGAAGAMQLATSIDPDVVAVVTIIGAALAGLVAALTAEVASTMLGVRRGD